MSQTHSRVEHHGSFSGTEITIEHTSERDDNEPSMEFDALSEEERLERAKQLMDEEDATHLAIDVGEVEKLDNTTLIEKTKNGFIVYDVL